MDQELKWITARDILDPSQGNAALTQDDLNSLHIPASAHASISAAHTSLTRQWYSTSTYGKTTPGPCPVKIDQNDKWPTLESLDATAFYRYFIALVDTLLPYNVGLTPFVAIDMSLGHISRTHHPGSWPPENRCSSQRPLLCPPIFPTHRI